MNLIISPPTFAIYTPFRGPIQRFPLHCLLARQSVPTNYKRWFGWDWGNQESGVSIVINLTGSYSFDSRCRRDGDFEIIGNTVSYLVIEFGEDFRGPVVGPGIGPHVNDAHAIGSGSGFGRNGYRSVPTFCNIAVRIVESIVA